MKYNKHILEAINRGVRLALDNFNDLENTKLFSKSSIIKNDDSTKNLIELHKWYVDLGLPSGTLWSKYNLGVNPDKLSNILSSWYGHYYAWGEIEHKYGFDENSYKWFKGKNHKLTKYNTIKKDGIDDGMIRLLPEDDAATQHMPVFSGYEAQIPDFRDLDELRQYTTHKSVRDYAGIQALNGEVITSKVNGNEIFLPYSGIMYVGLDTDMKGAKNYYWIRCNSMDKKAHCFSFDRFNNGILNLYQYKDIIVQMPERERWKGLSIRAIAKKVG